MVNLNMGQLNPCVSLIGHPNFLFYKFPNFSFHLKDKNFSLLIGESNK